MKPMTHLTRAEPDQAAPCDGYPKPTGRLRLDTPGLDQALGVPACPAKGK